MCNLSTYLSEHQISQRDFAARLFVDKSIVSRLTRDEMRPSLDLAVRIERETNGAVPATSWVPAPQTQPPAEDAA